MRYYIYISSAKLDMLFPQVPGATLFEAQQKTFDSQIARLNIVEEHILSSNEVGTATQKRPWLRGTLDAKFVDIGNDAILFVARKANTFLALGGSAHHLIGGARPDPVNIPFSYLYRLTRALTSLVERNPEFLLKLPEKDMKTEISAAGNFDAWMQVIFKAWSDPAPIPQRIEFLAKRLVSQKTHNGKVFTLATPLYVALNK